MNESPKNIYENSLKFGEKRKNTGFDYHQENILLKKTMMPRMFLNENVTGFLTRINNIMVNNIDAVKVIRNFFNYTVPKNDLNID
jgi:hypothetical protein